jgi:DNA topoisomerase IB-like protein
MTVYSPLVGEAKPLASSPRRQVPGAMPIDLPGSRPVPQLAVIPDRSVGHRQVGWVVRRSSPDVLTREREFDDDRGKDERLGAVKINHSVLTRRIDELYADAQVCAQVAGLAYVRDNEPGILRQRRGRGWSLRDAGNRPLTDREVKARILALAIPPAWRDVCDFQAFCPGVPDRRRLSDPRGRADGRRNPDSAPKAAFFGGGRRQCQAILRSRSRPLVWQRSIVGMAVPLTGPSGA